MKRTLLIIADSESTIRVIPQNVLNHYGLDMATFVELLYVNKTMYLHIVIDHASHYMWAFPFKSARMENYVI